MVFLTVRNGNDRCMGRQGLASIAEAGYRLGQPQWLHEIKFFLLAIYDLHVRFCLDYLRSIYQIFSGCVCDVQVNFLRLSTIYWSFVSAITATCRSILGVHPRSNFTVYLRTPVQFFGPPVGHCILVGMWGEHDDSCKILSSS